MELFRALAALVEPPSETTASIVGLLELGDPPSREEYADLFLRQLFPYASVYLGEEGKIGGEAQDRIAGFWRVFDRTPPTDPDHVTVLLATYAQLYELDSDAPGDAHGWHQARKAFFWEHLASWLPMFLAKLEELEEEGFYRRWGELCRGSLENEAERLGDPETLPVPLQSDRGLADPRQEGAEEFVGSLLAPGRSGVLLTGQDLVRCARETGLSVRIAERRFVLESLLGQRAADTLAWLAAESTRVAEVWGGLVAWRPVCGVWIGRAEAGRDLLGELADSARD